MPIFEYRCEHISCLAFGRRVEMLILGKQESAPCCEECGLQLNRVPSAFGGYGINGDNSASVRPKSAGYRREK